MKSKSTKARLARCINGALCAVVLVAITGCTSPKSVRELSHGQSERLNQFKTNLVEALTAARNDREFRLKAHIFHWETQIEVAQAEIEEAQKKNPPPDAEIRKSKEEIQRLKGELEQFRIELANVDRTYSSYSDYLDKVIIRAQTELDLWHNRPGICLFDNDALSMWAKAFATTGITKDSIKDLNEVLKKMKDEVR